MKKLVAILMACLMTVGALAGCGPATQNSASAETSSTALGATNSPASGETSSAASEPAPEEENIFAGIEPLATPVTLNLGYLNGSNHGAVTLMIDRLGGFEQVGININLEVFGNGPIMVEALASDSWDCGTVGLGGTLTGVITKEMLVVGAAISDYETQRILAQNDSDIVKDGITIAEYGLYGKPETWKGKEILLPNGTTLHYMLSVGLEKLGLQATDVKITHMDVTNVNTAMRANQGELGAMWGNFVYAADIDEKFTPVMMAEKLGINLPTVMVVNPRSYADEAKYAAIQKWMELYFRMVEWFNASDGNFRAAAEMFTDINEEQGVTGTVEENMLVLKQKCYSLEDNYHYFNDRNEEGMLTIEAMHYDPLQFYISQGSYRPEDAEKLLGGYFRNDIINVLYEQKISSD